MRSIIIAVVCEQETDVVKSMSLKNNLFVQVFLTINENKEG